MDSNSGRDPAPGFPPNDDEISLVELASIVLRRWKVIVLPAAVLALAVGVWTVLQDRLYAASASFFPQAAEQRGAGGAAVLAQQLGVALGPDRPAHSPQFYADLLRSRALLRSAVESEYLLPGSDRRDRRGNLVDYYRAEARDRAPAWLTAVDSLRRNVTVRVVRETGIVEMSVLARDPDVAEQVAGRLLDLLNTFNMEVRQAHGREEGRFIAARVEEAQAELASAENALQEFLRQNREFRNSPVSLFEHDRLRRDMMMRQEVYTSLLRSQEQARLDGVRDTPLITVIDQPAGSAEPKPRGTIVRASVSLLLGLILFGTGAVVFDRVRRGHQGGDSSYQGGRSLAGDAGT